MDDLTLFERWLLGQPGMREKWNPQEGVDITVADTPGLTDDLAESLRREVASRTCPNCGADIDMHDLRFLRKCLAEIAVAFSALLPVARSDAPVAECERPCAPPGCTECAAYWQRMIAEGFWGENGWTDRGMREMTK
mgnify:CR=1 FL=1